MPVEGSGRGLLSVRRFDQNVHIRGRSLLLHDSTHAAGDHLPGDRINGRGADRLVQTRFRDTSDTFAAVNADPAAAPARTDRRIGVDEQAGSSVFVIASILADRAEAPAVRADTHIIRPDCYLQAFWNEQGQETGLSAGQAQFRGTHGGQGGAGAGRIAQPQFPAAAVYVMIKRHMALLQVMLFVYTGYGKYQGKYRTVPQGSCLSGLPPAFPLPGSCRFSG